MSLGSSLKYHLLKLSSCFVYVCGTVGDTSYTELQMETADCVVHQLLEKWSYDLNMLLKSIYYVAIMLVFHSANKRKLTASFISDQ